MCEKQGSCPSNTKWVGFACVSTETAQRLLFAAISMVYAGACLPYTIYMYLYFVIIFVFSVVFAFVFVYVFVFVCFCMVCRATDCHIQFTEHWVLCTDRRLQMAIPKRWFDLHLIWMRFSWFTWKCIERTKICCKNVLALNGIYLNICFHAKQQNNKSWCWVLYIFCTKKNGRPCHLREACIRKAEY